MHFTISIKNIFTVALRSTIARMTYLLIFRELNEYNNDEQILSGLK